MDTDARRYYQRTVIKKQIPSRLLDEPRSVRVFLPPDYNEENIYPVIYCQDGEDFFRMGRIATHAMRLMLDEGLRPAIIVGVDVDKKRRAQEYMPEGRQFQAYSLFFDEELVPYIERHFPVSQHGDGRILAGISLGAAFSLHLALEHPERYPRLISLSGAFITSVRQRAARERDLSPLRLYMVIGLDESEVQTERGTFDFLSMHRQMADALRIRKARLSVKETEGRHIWGFWQKQLPQALKYFLQ